MSRQTTQANSRSAVLGYLAAGAAGQNLDRKKVAPWLRRQGLDIGEGGLRDALSRRLAKGSEIPEDEDPTEYDWVRKGLNFDATKLDLDLALVTFPAPNHAGGLLEALRSTERVVRIYRGYDRELVVVLVHDGARERRRLQSLLEEHEPNLRWLVIREVDDTFAAATWLSLAQRVAKSEGLWKR